MVARCSLNERAGGSGTAFASIFLLADQAIAAIPVEIDCPPRVRYSGAVTRGKIYGPAMGFSSHELSPKGGSVQ